jgi:hypothetical protein
MKLVEISPDIWVDKDYVRPLREVVDKIIRGGPCLT